MEKGNNPQRPRFILSTCSGPVINSRAAG